MRIFLGSNSGLRGDKPDTAPYCMQIKVKAVVVVLIKHHAMKTYGEEEVRPIAVINRAYLRYSIWNDDYKREIQEIEKNSNVLTKYLILRQSVVSGN